MRSLFALAVCAGLAAPAAAQEPKKDPPKKQERPEPTLKVGDKAPPVKATKWLHGAEVKELAAGKVYVVEFWATWCGPCIVMMPHMGELQTQFKDKVTIIGYSAKDPNNSQEKVAAFVEKRGAKLGYTFAYADDRETYDAWMKAAGQNGIPCCFVVDQAGKIAYIGHPMYLDVVLPKVVAGKFTEADLEAVKAIEKEVSAVFQAGGKEPEAFLGADRVPAEAPGAEGHPVLPRDEAERDDPDQADRRGQELAEGAESPRACKTEDPTVLGLWRGAGRREGQQGTAGAGGEGGRGRGEGGRREGRGRAVPAGRGALRHRRQGEGQGDGREGGRRRRRRAAEEAAREPDQEVRRQQEGRRQEG
jgi:thiol-disulfide isomerase/thioredoxin